MPIIWARNRVFSENGKLRIICPLCGPRPHDEFVYKGDASPKRPDYAKNAELSKWVDYVYMRDNPKGWLVEYWYHASGCGAWLIAERNTVNHLFRSVSLANSHSGNK